jgi:hypothetical protein
MAFGCGFGWPKKGSADIDKPCVVKSTEDYSPIRKARLAKFYRSREVHVTVDRSMCPSPELAVEARCELKGFREDDLEVDSAREQN